LADVYHVRLPGGNAAFVVLVTGHLASERPFAEAFVLRPGRAPALRAMRFAVRRPDGQVAIALVSLVDPAAVAKDWAVGELEGDLLEWHRQQPVGTPYPDPPALELLSGEPLVRLWVAGVLRDEIPQISDATRSVELRDFVNKLVQLPPIERLDLAKHPQTVPGQAPGARP
jgi:hypothetical protein